MRRRNRELNVFSISALDLFASAMGAFILITLVTLPFYLNTDRDVMAQNEALKKENDAARKKAEELAKKLEEKNKEAEKLKSMLSQTYLVVLMKWETNADIDLWVVVPEGHEYSFKKHNRRNAQGRRQHFSNHDAELSLDMRWGPGIEVWEMHSAKPGEYKVYFHHYPDDTGRRTRNPVNVSGTVFTRGGSRAIGVQSLAYQEKKLAAVITVGADGTVTFR